MNARQFFDRVAMLRRFQKEYFTTRSRSAMLKAIELEKEIDSEIARVYQVLSKTEYHSKLKL